MTSAAWTTFLRAVAGFALLVLPAWPASAQVKETQPWQPPVPAVEAKPRTATSDLAASTAAATATERRDARALTGAVFAKPAAAARAVQKADAAHQPDLSTVGPKAEWTAEKAGVGIGGKGVQIKTPF